MSGARVDRRRQALTVAVVAAVVLAVAIAVAVAYQVARGTHGTPRVVQLPAPSSSTTAAAP